MATLLEGSILGRNGPRSISTAEGTDGGLVGCIRWEWVMTDETTVDGRGRQAQASDVCREQHKGGYGRSSRAEPSAIQMSLKSFLEAWPKVTYTAWPGPDADELMNSSECIYSRMQQNKHIYIQETGTGAGSKDLIEVVTNTSTAWASDVHRESLFAAS